MSHPYLKGMAHYFDSLSCFEKIGTIGTLIYVKAKLYKIVTNSSLTEIIWSLYLNPAEGLADDLTKTLKYLAEPELKD